MVLEETQSVVLQQLGVSYPQLVDYYSKQYAATLVSPTHIWPGLWTIRSDQRRPNSVLWHC